MNLHPAERDYYRLTITLNIELDGTWEASFDGGTTWVAGEADPDVTGAVRWLLAGPDFDATSAGLDPAQTAATIATSVEPMLRLADAPVLDVETGPAVRLLVA